MAGGLEMNKQEKAIVRVLAAALAWCLYVNVSDKRRRAEADAEAARESAAQQRQVQTAKAAQTQPAAAKAAAQAPAARTAQAPEPELHDTFLAVSNADETVVFAANERGVSISGITLLGYGSRPGPIGEDNPPVTLDFGRGGRALAFGAGEGQGTLETVSPTCVVFRSASCTRRFTLAGGYRIDVEEEFKDGFAPGSLSLGGMETGTSENDLLSIDSMLHDNGKGRPEAVHHDEDDALKG